MSRAKRIALASVVVLLVGVVAVLGSRGASGSLVDNVRLRELSAEGVRLVDVRSFVEYAGGHIPEAENVPVDALAEAAAAWDTDEPIVCYCAKGGRSAEAATALRSWGFETVYDLEGGIEQWDGTIETAFQSAEEPEPSTSGLPVMYYFFTDW